MSESSRCPCESTSSSAASHAELACDTSRTSGTLIAETRNPPRVNKRSISPSSDSVGDDEFDPNFRPLKRPRRQGPLAAQLGAQCSQANAKEYYCNRLQCRAAHTGKLALLRQAADALFQTRCEVTGNDPLCEAAVQGHSVLVQRLLLEGFDPAPGKMLCWPKRTFEEVLRDNFSDEGPKNTGLGFSSSSLLHVLALSCRGVQSDEIPWHPQDLDDLVRCMYVVLRNPDFRVGLMNMKKDFRWKQIVRNWDYFQEQTFFNISLPIRGINEEFYAICGSVFHRGEVRYVGRAVMDEACRELLLHGVPWASLSKVPALAPDRLRYLVAWHTRTSRGISHAKNHFVALPDDIFERLIDFLVYRQSLS